MTFIATPPPLIIDHPEPPPGTWEREASHFPAPMSPFSKSLFLIEEWGRQIGTETGSLMETIRFIEIGGWVYNRVVPFGERPGAPTPPAWMLTLLLRSVPSLRHRVATAKAALDQDWSGRQIDTWYRRRDDLSAQLTALRRADLPGMSNDALDEQVRSVITLAHDCLDLHFRLHTAIAHDLRAFTVTCHELLGWDNQRSLSMLAGTSTASTDAGRALTDLAHLAAQSEDLRHLVLTEPVDRVLAAADVDGARDFRTQFAAYLDRYCARALTYDVTDPILSERPELVLNLIRDQLTSADRSHPGVNGSADIDEARTRLDGASPQVRTCFEDRLARAMRAYPVREDNAYLTVCAPIALLRTTGLEMGRRLFERGQLDTVEDVFFLHVDEARSALLEESDVRALIERRRQHRLHTLANPGPQRYGPKPGPVAVHRMPAPARESTADVLWLLDQVMPTPGPGLDAPRTTHEQIITGTPAARGTARGPARIVRDESEFNKLHTGDVLVCECTSPAWSIVFPSLSAVVTDSGGMLSHPAIVAREFGIPAVVATGDATTRLSDGQLVVVDGAAGTVKVVAP